MIDIFIPPISSTPKSAKKQTIKFSSAKLKKKCIRQQSSEARSGKTMKIPVGRQKQTTKFSSAKFQQKENASHDM